MKKKRKKISVIAVINFALGVITFPIFYLTSHGLIFNTIKMIMHGSDSQITTTIFQVSILLFLGCLVTIGFFQILLFKESKKILKAYIKSEFIGFHLGSAVVSLYFWF